MNNFNIQQHPHRRLNLLTGEWILVSPHRNDRPWQGKTENLITEKRPQYDAECYLCPNNKRATENPQSAIRNPNYSEPFVFTNDYSALLENSPTEELNIKNILQTKSDRGICRVISFSPNHSLTLATMEVADIYKVIALWQEEFKDLSENKFIKYIQIFENKGEMMGCSNPHPHGQIWASEQIPTEIQKENLQQLIYFNKHKKSLLKDYLEVELKQKERIILENKYFVALVPFWAVYPFETMIISRNHLQNITQFSETEKLALAEIMKQLLVKYDALFGVSFPYSAGMHQPPVNDGEHTEWHWHFHFYPPLLRSATIKKFMVGYELLCSPQRDFTPEWAAEKLRKC